MAVNGTAEERYVLRSNPYRTADRAYSWFCEPAASCRWRSALRSWRRYPSRLRCHLGWNQNFGDRRRRRQNRHNLWARTVLRRTADDLRPEIDLPLPGY